MSSLCSYSQCKYINSFFFFLPALERGSLRGRNPRAGVKTPVDNEYDNEFLAGSVIDGIFINSIRHSLIASLAHIVDELQQRH